MIHIKKIIAAAMVAACLLLAIVFPASAASAKGRFGGGGFNPPISDTNVVKSNILFVPYGVASNGIYKGKYFTFDDDVNARVIYRENSDKTFDVGLQVWRSTSGSIAVGQSKTVVNWHSSTQTFNFTAFSTTLKSGKYGTYIPLYNCTFDDFIFNSDFTFATYVVDEYFYNESVLTANAPFYPADSQSGQVYYIPTPLVSNESKWTYNYGYETEQERQEAIDKIDAMMNKITAKMTEIGSVQNRLESTMEFQEVQRQALTSANSLIKDADIAKESANYVKNQILQNVTSTLLSTANQNPSIALQLI